MRLPGRSSRNCHTFHGWQVRTLLGASSAPHRSSHAVGEEMICARYRFKEVCVGASTPVTQNMSMEVNVRTRIATLQIHQRVDPMLLEVLDDGWKRLGLGACEHAPEVQDVQRPTSGGFSPSTRTGLQLQLGHTDGQQLQDISSEVVGKTPLFQERRTPSVTKYFPTRKTEGHLL